MRAALVVAGAMLAVSSALAQPACMSIEQLQQILREKYNEVPLLAARIEDGKMLVIFSSDNGGSWTAAIVTPAGIACVGPSGDALRLLRSGA